MTTHLHLSGEKAKAKREVGSSSALDSGAEPAKPTCALVTFLVCPDLSEQPLPGLLSLGQAYSAVTASGKEFLTISVQADIPTSMPVISKTGLHACQVI